MSFPLWWDFPFIKNFITKKYIFWRKFRKQNLVRIEEKVFWLVGCSCVQKRKKCRMVWSIFSNLWSRLLNFPSKTVRSPKFLPTTVREFLTVRSFYRFILDRTPFRGPKLFCPNFGPIITFVLRTGPNFGTNLDRNSYLVKSDYPCSSINEDELENMKAAPLFNWPISVELISPPASHWSKTIFKKPFYRAGINDSGIKRISKLAIQRDLPLNFVIALNNVYGLPSNDVIIDQENLKNKISDLLNDVEISNECIGTVR